MFKRSEVHMGFSVENKRITGIGLFECFIGVLLESIGKLKSLQELDLGCNKLTTLPESILKLTKLKRLNISNNPLARKPDSRTKSILKQLKKNNIDIYV